MAYTNAWSNSIPAGSVAANLIDDHIRQLRLDLQERMADVVQDFTVDPVGIKSRRVKLNRTGALNIGNSAVTWTTIDWDSEVYDSDTMHDLVTNPTRITIPAGVAANRLIRVYGNITIDMDGTGAMQVRIKKNGAEIARSVCPEEVTGANTRTVSIYVEDVGSASDYYELEAIQLSGADRALNTGTTLTFFGASFH